MQPYFAGNPMIIRLAAIAGRLYGSPRQLGIVLLVALLAGWIGPFGTHADFGIVEHHVYWLLIALFTVPLANVVYTRFERRLDKNDRFRTAGLLAIGLVAAFPIAGIVLVIGLPFGFRPGLVNMAELYLQCAVIMALLSAGMVLLRADQRTATAHDAVPILKRIPGACRGALIRMSAQDHYVEIVTDRGRSLVMMRFRDALEETGATAGCQVHRSHWVATDAVAGQQTIDGRLQVTLTDGTHVPVGRKFRRAAREAAILV